MSSGWMGHPAFTSSIIVTPPFADAKDGPPGRLGAAATSARASALRQRVARGGAVKGQRDREGGACAGPAVDLEGATMLGDDRMTDAQAQARAARGLPGREERIEDVRKLVGRNARPVVGDDEPGLIALCAGADLDVH